MYHVSCIMYHVPYTIRTHVSCIMYHITSFFYLSHPPFSYVLFHHVMGNLEGRRGAWGYVQGGMGALSLALARRAKSLGVHVAINAPVSRIHLDNNHVTAVELFSGRSIETRLAMSNATPHVTFKELLDADRVESLKGVSRAIGAIDYGSATMKINVAVRGLPVFRALSGGGMYRGAYEGMAKGTKKI